MKKNLYRSLLLAAFTVAFNAQGADGNVSILANFAASTCNVSSDSANMTVPLGDIQRTELSTKGAMTAKVPFTLKLTDCVAHSYIWVAFEGTATASDYLAFALDNQGQSGTASGVGLEIANWLRTAQPNVANYIDTSSSPGGNYSLDFSARYKALSDDVKPGQANVTVQYSVTYM